MSDFKIAKFVSTFSLESFPLYDNYVLLIARCGSGAQCDNHSSIMFLYFLRVMYVTLI